jgi:chromosome segregation ATPase
LSAVVEAMEKDMAELAAKGDESSKEEIQTLRRRLEECDAVAKQQREDSESAAAQLNEVKSALESAKEALASKQREASGQAEQLVSRVKELEGDLEKETSKAADMESKLSRSDADLEQARSKIEDTERGLREVTAQLASVREDGERLASEMRQEIAAKSLELRGLQEKSVDSDNQVAKTVTMELEDLKKQLAAKTLEEGNARAQVEKVSADLAVAHQAAAALRDSTNELTELVESSERTTQILEKELAVKKAELASLAEAMDLLDVYAKKEGMWQETEKILLEELKKAQSSGSGAAEELIQMLDDERKLRKELEIEAITIQDEFAKILANNKTQTEIAELLEAENKRLEGQLVEVMQLLEQK